MTTIVWYHVLWQVTFPLCTSQQDSDNLRSRHVRSILLESLSPEASVNRKTDQWPAGNSFQGCDSSCPGGWMMEEVWSWDKYYRAGEIRQVSVDRQGTKHFIVKLTLEWSYLVFSISAFLVDICHSAYVRLQDWPKMGKVYHFPENQMGSQHYWFSIMSYIKLPAALCVCTIV